MDFRFNEEQEELRSIARAFLAESSGSEQVRSAMESELGWSEELWTQLGSELGWASVQIPEAYGGLDLGYVELAALMEIAGEHLLCAPFFSSACLGANALLTAGSEAQKTEWLPGIAEGQCRATLAHAGPGGGPGCEAVTPIWKREGGEFILDGTHSFVVDGHSADLLIVAARREGSQGAEGIGLFSVPGDAGGLERVALTTLDQTRRLARLDFTGVRVPESALLGGSDEAGAALERTLQLSTIGLAAEQVGGAQRCLDMSVEYALEREQFGRPIGSFQSIKHKCADMMVAVEAARSAAYYAACVAAEGGDELPTCAALAAAECAEAYFRCAADAIQIHGGVGFTWEYDIHLHFKRAKAGETLLGEPSYHREFIAQEIGL
ncbi:MAG: acyl-CoA/acyl-ACP dehydrogenase [Myxococcota bacterium]|nr:acyl-CoA/acyl-ACP dehydrogenase [Myxococcota bacterium]